MNHHIWRIAAALLALPLVALARSGPKAADPADSAYPVPSSIYVSDFDSYRRDSSQESGSDTTPDRSWRQANDEMKRLGGHAGHMKDASATPEPGHDMHRRKGQ